MDQVPNSITAHKKAPGLHGTYTVQRNKYINKTLKQQKHITVHFPIIQYLCNHRNRVGPSAHGNNRRGESNPVSEWCVCVLEKNAMLQVSVKKVAAR